MSLGPGLTDGPLLGDGFGAHFNRLLEVGVTGPTTRTLRLVRRKVNTSEHLFSEERLAVPLPGVEA